MVATLVAVDRHSRNGKARLAYAACFATGRRSVDVRLEPRDKPVRETQLLSQGSKASPGLREVCPDTVLQSSKLRRAAWAFDCGICQSIFVFSRRNLSISLSSRSRAASS